MLEVCVEEGAGIAAAVQGGGDRMELCAGLSVGGLTPSASLIRLAAAAPIPTLMLARPRDGDFRYDTQEAALIAQDITDAAEAGLAGVVIGASNDAGGLDVSLLQQWVAHARQEGEKRGRTLSLTLHRAFDLCADPLAAMEQAITLGFDRILTSGCQPRAIDGVETLGKLVRQADGRIIILAGGGVDAASVPALLAAGVREIHASCRAPLEAAGDAERRFGFQNGPRLRTNAEKVAQLRSLLPV
ncbi:copper homeostasis protein CutC [Niveispirillum irakense]|uniref:copper homeostasis protein CutC n=1 Tax=Niveispirillum irakense TaxID=34011 RepID=UPI000427B7CB|nr:copper homeostasis protein CutC [Niveispirillum irakense]